MNSETGLDGGRWAALVGFVDGLRVARLAHGTVLVYRSGVLKWLRFGGAPGHVDGGLLVRYLADRRRSLSVATVNGDIRALRRFYRWQVQCGHCASGELRKIPKFRCPPARLPRTLDDLQIARLLTAPDPDTWVGFRDTVLLRVLCDCGLRTSHAARLTVGDVLDDGMLHVGRSWRREVQYIPLSDELQRLLRTYIGRRHEVRPGKRSALFLNRNGRPMPERGICSTVSAHIRRAVGPDHGSVLLRLTGRPWQGHYPHQLRATLIQAYLERGLDAVRVAQMLGLADVASVQRYQAINTVPLRAAVALHPRAKR